MQQKIKQDISIGKNIRKLRLERGIGQTECAKKLQLSGCDITRESLVKIERCTQHIQATQLLAIQKALNVSLEELFVNNSSEEE